MERVLHHPHIGAALDRAGVVPRPEQHVLPRLAAALPAVRIGLVHGRMPGGRKDAVMTAFKQGELDLLVATTVIEVGVDVPEATVMAIEHAERFGLAQLHQLRGRVGRGAAGPGMRRSLKRRLITSSATRSNIRPKAQW